MLIARRRSRERSTRRSRYGQADGCIGGRAADMVSARAAARRIGKLQIAHDITTGAADAGATTLHRRKHIASGRQVAARKDQRAGE